MNLNSHRGLLRNWVDVSDMHELRAFAWKMSLAKIPDSGHREEHEMIRIKRAQAFVDLAQNFDDFFIRTILGSKLAQNNAALQGDGGITAAGLDGFQVITNIFHERDPIGSGEVMY